MKVYHLLLIIILLGYPLYKLIKKLERMVKKELVEYKKAGRLEKEMRKITFWIVSIPLIIYLMDKFNLFSFLGFTKNINMNFDWLAFVGAYLGTIINVIFLLYVTKIDREDNNENVRASQRPCLSTRMFLPNNFRMTDTSLEGYICQDNENKNTTGNYVIRISNSGQTVAIIDMEKSYIVAKKTENVMKKINENMSEMDLVFKEEKVFLKKYEDRLHINSNSKAEIVITDDGMYRNIHEKDKVEILEVYIEYIDLFGKRYKDYIKIEDGKTRVVVDNELIK